MVLFGVVALIVLTVLNELFFSTRKTDHFKYTGKIAETEIYTAEYLADFEGTKTLSFPVNFLLNSDNSCNFVVQSDSLKILLKNIGYENSYFYFNTKYLGLMSATLNFHFTDGTMETAGFDLGTADAQHLITIQRTDGVINCVEIELVSVSGEVSEIQSLTNDSHSSIYLLSANTVKSTVDATIEFYDKYSNAVNILYAIKDGQYILNNSVKSYRVLHKE